MPATPARAAFVQESYRSAVWRNSAVRDLYGKVARDTKDEPIPTFFDDIDDVQTMVDERGVLLGQHARAFRVKIGALMDMTNDLDFSQTLPAAALLADELAADFACAVPAVESYDTGNDVTTLSVWGICGTIEDTDDGEGGDGGDGGDEDWIEAFRAPSDDLPLIVADFKTGRYWMDGAEVEEDDIFEANVDYGAYTPGGVVPGSGLPKSRPVLNAAAAAVAGDEATIVIAARMSSTGQSFGLDYTNAPSAGAQRYMQMLSDESGPGMCFVESYDGVQDVICNPDAVVGAGVTHKLAATLGLTHLAGSSDGQDPAVTASPTTPAVPYDTIGIIMLGSTGGFIESLVIYPVQPDADLPTLST
jgi:hypothetical protein